MSNLTIKMPEKLKKQAQGKAYNEGKLAFGLMNADDEVTASFDVSTKEGKQACLTSFTALIQ